MSANVVFFLHRLGLKAYHLDPPDKITEMIDIASTDIPTLVAKFTQFKNQTVRLLMADPICYLLQSHIPKSNTPLSRELVLENIKVEIPENFENLNWDYKVVGEDETSILVTVFAPVIQFQKLIREISQQLSINFEAIEPESISASRHPNPVIGITLKEDLGAADSQSLNLAVKSTPSRHPVPWLKILGFIIFLGLFIGINYFLYLKFIKPPVSAPGTTIAPSPSPAVDITATPPVAKKFTNLNLSIKNGSGKTGYAGQIKDKFNAAGLYSITTGNADNNNYPASELVFQDESVKNQFTADFLKIFPVSSENITIDNRITFDAILILGQD